MKIRSFSALLLALFSIHSWAIEPIQVQIDQKVPFRNSVGVGSRLTLQSNSKISSGIFLGKLIDPKGTLNQFMILNESSARIDYVNRENLVMGKYSFQPILKPYDQIGGTCTGYAINHYFQQMLWSGFEGNGNLRAQLSTEKGRTQLLVDAINEYYLVLQHRYSLVGVMNKIAANYGFRCKSKSFQDSFSAIQHLLNELSTGNPLILSFSIGPNMVNAPVQLFDYQNPGHELDHRLWVPRKIGERNAGGHSVVAASLFQYQGRPFLLMLDSDWSEPRIWDVSAYLTDKTALNEVEFITCQ